MSNAKFAGLQKLTLLDFPGKLAATVFTSGCNFKCPFCHNAGLINESGGVDGISYDEVMNFLEKRAGVLDGICLTGGEPLVHPWVFDFVSEVKRLGLLVKLDTNGSFPKRLISLVDSGNVDYVAMDIKNCPERYAETVGISGLDIQTVEESADFLLSEENRVDYEFRTTVVREFHTIDGIEKMGRRFCGSERFFLQQFVDSGNTVADGLHAVSPEEMLSFKAVLANYSRSVKIRGLDIDN